MHEDITKRFSGFTSAYGWRSIMASFYAKKSFLSSLLPSSQVKPVLSTWVVTWNMMNRTVDERIDKWQARKERQLAELIEIISLRTKSSSVDAVMLQEADWERDDHLRKLYEARLAEKGWLVLPCTAKRTRPGLVILYNKNALNFTGKLRGVFENPQKQYYGFAATFVHKVSKRELVLVSYNTENTQAFDALQQQQIKANKFMIMGGITKHATVSDTQNLIGNPEYPATVNVLDDGTLSVAQKSSTVGFYVSPETKTDVYVTERIGKFFVPDKNDRSIVRAERLDVMNDHHSLVGMPCKRTDAPRKPEHRLLLDSPMKPFVPAAKAPATSTPASAVSSLSAAAAATFASTISSSAPASQETEITSRIELLERELREIDTKINDAIDEYSSVKRILDRANCKLCFLQCGENNEAAINALTAEISNNNKVFEKIDRKINKLQENQINKSQELAELNTAHSGIGNDLRVSNAAVPASNASVNNNVLRQEKGEIESVLNQIKLFEIYIKESAPTNPKTVELDGVLMKVNNFNFGELLKAWRIYYQSYVNVCRDLNVEPDRFEAPVPLAVTILLPGTAVPEPRLAETIWAPMFFASDKPAAPVTALASKSSPTPAVAEPAEMRTSVATVISTPLLAVASSTSHLASTGSDTASAAELAARMELLECELKKIEEEHIDAEREYDELLEALNKVGDELNLLFDDNDQNEAAKNQLIADHSKKSDMFVALGNKIVDLIKKSESKRQEHDKLFELRQQQEMREWGQQSAARIANAQRDNSCSTSSSVSNDEISPASILFSTRVASPVASSESSHVPLSVAAAAYGHLGEDLSASTAMEFPAENSSKDNVELLIPARKDVTTTSSAAVSQGSTYAAVTDRTFFAGSTTSASGNAAPPTLPSETSVAVPKGPTR